MNIEKTNKIIAVLEASKKPGAVVECKNSSGKWERIRPVWNCIGEYHYRVLLPTAGEKYHITEKEWEGQGVIWVSDYPYPSDSYSSHFLVNFIERLAFGVGQEVYTFDDFKNKWKWFSFDRKTWHPFTKIVAGELKVVASTELE